MDTLSPFFLLSLLLLLSCLSLSAAQKITQMERDESILLALKSHITSDSNMLKNNWTSGTSFCTWIGVTCDSRRSRVTKLNISAMELEGGIPLEIANLTSLVYLDLSQNSFHGRLPKDICTHNNLQRLKLLHLWRNKLEGEIPSSLYQCPQLESIDLSDNKFGGHVPREIGNITLLKKLYLSGNNLRGDIPKEIDNLNNLEILDMSSNKLGGPLPRQIWNITTLRFLSLHNISLTGRLTVPWPVSNRNSEKRRARFTIFPSDQRHWSVILEEESLRQTTLWSSVPPGPEDYVMSHPKMNLLPEKDSYETYLKMREKKKASGRGKKGGSGSEPVSESDVQVVEPSGRSKRKKKAAPFEVPDYSDGSIHLTLPSGTSAQTDYDSCADHFERLLLEDDRTRMLKVGVVDSASTAARLAFQGYQYTLFMKEQLVEAADQLKVALREQDALRKELEEEKGRYETAEKELRDELSLKSHLISALQSQIGQLEATLKVREEELQFSHLQTVVLTRGEMMKEFKEGKAGSWNVEKGIREMEDVLRDRAEGVGVVDATTDGEGDGSED